MLTLNQVSALTEEQARETLERILWPTGPVCPHCGSVQNLTRMQGEAHLAGLLRGQGEVDETYIGGKPRPKAGEPKAKPGRGTKKTPVVALVERGGRVRVRKIEHVDAATLKQAIRDNVHRDSMILTDE